MKTRKNILILLLKSLLILTIEGCSDSSKNNNQELNKTPIKNESINNVNGKLTDSKKRKDIVVEMNKKSEEWESKIIYSLDPNDDTTLELKAYSSPLSPEDYGGWKTFPELHGYDIENLKIAGFNKIRIYTKVGGNKYKLNIL